MSRSVPWVISRESATVISVRIDARRSPDWEQWILLTTDRHHDNLYCRHDLEKRHLDEARARTAGIINCGDLFCAMQGRWDKRADLTQLRPELHTPKYFDALVDYNSTFYLPYADLWMVEAEGNHETSILRHHQISLTDHLIQSFKLRGEHGSQVEKGTYQGWVVLNFRWCKTHSCSYFLRYTHGYGGGGPVTRDVIQSARQLVYLDGVDILVSGHTHDAWHVPIPREVLDSRWNPYLKTVHAVKCGGYKDEYSGGGGWANEKGMPPKPLGGFWIRFYFEGDRVQFDVTQTSQPRLAA